MSHIQVNLVYIKVVIIHNVPNLMQTIFNVI